MSNLQPTPTFKEYAITVIILLAVCYFFYSKMSGCMDSPSTPAPVEKFGKVDAYVDCQEKVKERLVSPGSAQFELTYEEAVKQINDSIFEIDAYVDSQNENGALLRTKFHGKSVYHAYNNTVEYKSFIIHKN